MSRSSLSSSSLVALALHRYGMDVDVGALLEMLDQVFEDVLEREGRPLEFGDLVEIFMNLRGSNPATVQDLKALIRSVKLMVKVEMCPGR